ncbi:hypothetical protein GWK16_08075 [Roseomonas sp. JC162]|uniref:Thioesterase domain-containing protein n=1 Tax=Neoroseomonas marina TaxID=1232220 RepID=A0A848ECK8_9PROT|nr:hypothetical protein [Neoroseomonas marina]NMJ41193.1 hypothetical protein [Neoroseomonas marina]
MTNDCPIPPRRAVLAGLLLLGACGPTRLAPLAGPAKGRVILLRGLANMFSTGLNTMTAELRQANYDASVHNHVEGRRLVEETVAAVNAGTLPRPLVLIGHSFGADEVLRMGGMLGAATVPVDLVVTFDPTVVGTAPPGPKRVVNFYQERDPLSRRVEPAPGFDGVIENRLVEGESHLSIEKAQRLHVEVLTMIEGIRPAPAPPPVVTPLITAPPPPLARPARLPLPPRPPAGRVRAS